MCISCLGCRSVTALICDSLALYPGSRWARKREPGIHPLQIPPKVRCSDMSHKIVHVASKLDIYWGKYVIIRLPPDK